MTIPRELVGPLRRLLRKQDSLVQRSFCVPLPIGVLADRRMISKVFRSERLRKAEIVLHGLWLNVCLSLVFWGFGPICGTLDAICRSVLTRVCMVLFGWKLTHLSAGGWRVNSQSPKPPRKGPRVVLVDQIATSGDIRLLDLGSHDPGIRGFRGFSAVVLVFPRVTLVGDLKNRWILCPRYIFIWGILAGLDWL